MYTKLEMYSLGHNLDNCMLETTTYYFRNLQLCTFRTNRQKLLGLHSREGKAPYFLHTELRKVSSWIKPSCKISVTNPEATFKFTRNHCTGKTFLQTHYQIHDEFSSTAVAENIAYSSLISFKRDERAEVELVEIGYSVKSWFGKGDSRICCKLQTAMPAAHLSLTQSMA